MHEIKCNITGRVQLVMFRDFAKRMADRLGIVGSVVNLADGSVRVIAQGKKEKLQEYIELLKKGPIFAKVLDIETLWREPTKDFDRFKILYDRK